METFGKWRARPAGLRQGGIESKEAAQTQLADQLAADFERDAVGQVAPVEMAGAEAVGGGVGVDDHGGDAAEATGVADADVEPAAAAAVVEAGDRVTVAFAI